MSSWSDLPNNRGQQSTVQNSKYVADEKKNKIGPQATFGNRILS